MNDFSNRPEATDETPRQLEKRLLADLGVEAADAPDGFKYLYRWLTETAAARRPIPNWGSRPHLAKVAVEMGIDPRRLPKGLSQTIARWHPRFREAFDPDEHRARMPTIANPSGVSAEEFADPAYRAALVEDLRSAKDAAPKGLHRCYDWLISRADAGEPMPVYHFRPNIHSIGKLMGVSNSYLGEANATSLFAFWLPRFRGEAISSFALRTQLPGSDHEGTAVPTGLLLKQLNEALAVEEDGNASLLIKHLIGIAESDRVIPRFNRGPNYRRLRQDAGVSETAAETPLDRIFRDWIGFFRVEDHTTFTNRFGETVRRPDAVTEVGRYLESLREAGMVRLKRSNHVMKNDVSLAAIARDLGVLAQSLKAPRTRALIGAYVKECRDHYGDGNEFDGVYDGLPKERRMELREYRNDVVAYIERETINGRTLPSRPIFPDRLDLDELIRRHGRPGPSLANDQQFKEILRKMDPKPTLAPYNVVATPNTYGQLVERLQQERLPTIGQNITDQRKRKNSISVTKSKIKGAIETFAKFHSKTLTDAVGDDFEEQALAEAKKAIIASGIKQSDNWEREIDAAKAFLEASLAANILRESFDVTLMNAIVKDGRSFKSIAAASGLTDDSLIKLAHGKAMPTRDERDMVVALENTLNLERDSLTKYIGEGQMRRKGKTAIAIPRGVREFLPDNYRTRSADELQAMVQWIQENLLSSNTPFGKAMSATKKRQHAKKLKDGEQATEPAVVANQISLDKMRHPAIGKALNKQLKHETAGLGRTVVEELGKLIEHMTEFMPATLERRPGSHWNAESTAPMRLGMIASFLRWQVRDEEEGGLERDPDHLTLGDLIHPPLVFAYLDYKARKNENVEHDGRRRGKRFTGSEVDILRVFGALLGDIYGFVTQSTEMAKCIKADTRRLDNGAFIRLDGHVYDDKENKRQDKADGRVGDFRPSEHEIMPRRFSRLSKTAFEEACAKARRMYASAQVQIDLYAEAGRDPAELIEGILDSERPMALLLRQLAIASQRVPAIKNGKQAHHLAIRDLLICRLLALTSLRSKNLREITIDGDDPKLCRDQARAGLRAKVEEKWLLEIHWSEFKNFRSAVLFGRRRKRQPYRKYLPDTQHLYALLEYYITVSRPYLLERKTGKKPNELFLTTNGNPLDGPGLWKAVSLFTARHVAWNPFREQGIPKVHPFGPHAFRDVRATDILLNPHTSNPYLEAALAIQTSSGMVQAHYGIVKSERRTAQDDETFVRSEKQGWAGLDDTRLLEVLKAA